MLLADIRAIFQTRNTDRLSSDQIVADLASLEGRPWPDFRRGFAITKHQLARLLAPFGIDPKTIRLAEKQTAKGYFLASFDDAFARYLPLQTVTSSQAN
jgi:hypothetical protein